MREFVKLVFVCLFLLVALVGPNSFADDIAPISIGVGRIQGSGIPKEELSIIRNLIRLEIKKRSSVTLGGRESKNRIGGLVTRTGEVTLIDLSIRLETGARRTRHLKLFSMDDLDHGVRLLLTSLLEDATKEKDLEFGEKPKAERQGITSQKAMEGLFFGGGLGFPLASVWIGNPKMFTIVLGLAWDVQWFLLELRADYAGAFSDPVRSFTVASVGAQFTAFEVKFFSAYFGAGVGYGFAIDNYGANILGVQVGQNINAQGLVMITNVGFLIFNHSDLNVDTQFRFHLMPASLMNARVPLFFTWDVVLRL